MPSTPDLLKFAFAWWVIGLVVVSWFILSIRPSEAEGLYAKMRVFRGVTLTLVMREAWIWPLWAVGLFALALKRRLDR